MNKKLLAAGVIVALLAGWTGAALQPDVRVEVPAAPQLGALSGPDLPYDHISVGGVARYSLRRELATATTTPCRIQAPSSTSTLVSTSLMITTATSTQTLWTAATTTNALAFATTTKLNDYILLSGTQGSFLKNATSSSTTDGKGLMMEPNAWVVWGVQGTAISDATKLNGFCSAEFIAL